MLTELAIALWALGVLGLAVCSVRGIVSGSPWVVVPLSALWPVVVPVAALAMAFLGNADSKITAEFKNDDPKQ